MAFGRNTFSPLPTPTREYDQRYMHQLVRSIEAYFRSLTAGGHTSSPYAGIGLVPGQTAVAPSTPEDIGLDLVGMIADGFGTDTADTIFVRGAGVYRISLTAQFTNSGGSEHMVTITPDPAMGLGGTTTVPAAGSASYTGEIYTQLAAGSELSFTWSVSDTDVQLVTGQLLIQYLSAK